MSNHLGTGEITQRRALPIIPTELKEETAQMAILNAKGMQMNEDGYVYNQNCYHSIILALCGGKKED